MSTDKPHSTVATRMTGIREDWLAAVREEILEPGLPIVDPHHHLWDFPAHRYLLPDLLADTGSGHRIESTVFIECTACYRADGPAELKTLGETEFVNGIAAMSASPGSGPSTTVSEGVKAARGRVMSIATAGVVVKVRQWVSLSPSEAITTSATLPLRT